MNFFSIFRESDQLTVLLLFYEKRAQPRTECSKLRPKKIFMAIPHKSPRESDERFFVRKRWKTAGILCVFQGQYRIIRQGDLAWNFASQICCENAGILCVFQIFAADL